MPLTPHRLIAALLLTLALATGCRRQSPSATADGGGGVVAELSPADSARALMAKVDHYYKNVIHDSLYSLAPQAMDFYQRHGRWQEYYTTWCLLVNDYVWNGLMDKGLDEAQRMHQDAIRRHNDFGIAEAYTAMGIAYHFQNNNKESVRSYRLALAHYPKDTDQSVKQNIYSYFCQVLLETEDGATTDSVFAQWASFLDQQTRGDKEDAKYAHWYFRYHRERYKYRYAQGQYQEAASELDAMQHFLEKEDDRQMYEAQVAGFRTQLAMARRDYAQAMAYSDLEVELGKRQDFNTFLNALKHRTDVLQGLGRYEEALKAWRSYDRQKDSLIKADTRQQLNELNKRFEVDELKAQQERDLLEHERSLLRLTLAFAAVVVAALVLFILFRHRANRRVREAHALLERSYEQLKVANERAEESSRMKTDFIQQISHEIRTPLNILSGFTQVITTPGMELSDEEMYDIQERIEENTNRITELVNKMLELSEASSQTVITRDDDVLALQIATQAVADSGIAQAEHVGFELVSADGADATVSHTNLRSAARALTCLLDNAQKFTKQGRVTLTVGASQTAVRFVVEDTGIGLPPGASERIFDEFVQLDEYYEGTGIGLTIARSTARRLGGDVVLDTSYGGPGIGARFTLTLPLG